MARSFSVPCGLDSLLQHLADVRRAVPSAAGGIVFVSGPLTQQVPAVAELVRNAWRGVPACVVPAAGVLSERGEIEGESAASGVLWAGGRATPLLLGANPGGAPGTGARAPAPDIAGRDSPGEPLLARAPAPGASGRAATAILFAQPESFSPAMFHELAASAPKACLFGAGTVGGGAAGITEAGELLVGPAVALTLAGLAPPIVEASPACRLLSSFEPIQEVSGGLVLRAGGRAALDILSASTAGLVQRPGPAPVVFVALADEPGLPPTESPAQAPAGGPAGAPALPDELPRYVIRPVRGVDPTRRGVVIGDGARIGARMAFAVRDAAAARAGLEDMARRVSRSALGSAPRFALFLSCAGRGQGLYSAPDVEVRILRQRFSDLPIAGMQSAFEITPWASGQARLAMYTGVLALFRAPS